MATEQNGSSWCFLIVSTATIIATSIGIIRLSRGPRRMQSVHTELFSGRTARVLQIGSWSERDRSWTGPTRFEFADPEGSIGRVKSNITSRERALEFARNRCADSRPKPGHRASLPDAQLDRHPDPIAQYTKSWI
jgi:hypothetical protein